MTAQDLPPAGIGHNHAPAPVSLWHQHMWARARAEHSDSRLPLPVIRMRMARAAELGMAYSDYAALYRTAGRDPAGLLFTPDALQLRRPAGLNCPPPCAPIWRRPKPATFWHWRLKAKTPPCF